MALVRLIYGSTVTEKLSGPELEEILINSRRNNAAKNISGLLWFNSNYIIQAIEGHVEHVNSLYLKLGKDPRHTALQLLSYDVIHKREFDKWSMGYVPNLKHIRPTMLAYTTDGEFNPYALLGAAALELMKAIRINVADE